MKFFKIIFTMIFLLCISVLSAEMATDSISFQAGKKHEIVSIFELNIHVQPIGWGECNNTQVGCDYEIANELSGSIGLSLGRLINNRHILKLNVQYMLTKLKYNSWAVVPDPVIQFNERFLQSLLIKPVYEIMTYSNKKLHLNPFLSIGSGIDIPLSFILYTESGIILLYGKYGIISAVSYRPFGPRYKHAFNISFGIVFRILN